MSIFGETNNQDAVAKTEKKATKKPAAKPAAKKKATEKASMKDLYKDETKVAKKSSVGTSKYNNAYRILVKPLVTEKAANMGTINKYAFEVSLNANKVETAKAIEQVYGIKPINVNIIRMEGKAKNYGRIKGKRKDWKKAIVTMPAGKTIQVYEGV